MSSQQQRHSNSEMNKFQPLRKITSFRGLNKFPNFRLIALRYLAKLGGQKTEGYSCARLGELFVNKAVRT